MFVSVSAPDIRQIQMLVCCDEKLKKLGNSTRSTVRRCANFDIPKNDSCTSFPVLCSNEGSGIIFILFETLISESSLKLEGSMHQYNALRLLHSTTDYGQPSCFGHLECS